MIRIVRNRLSLVITTRFRRVSGEGPGLVLADGLVSLAGGRRRLRPPVRGDAQAGFRAAAGAAVRRADLAGGTAAGRPGEGRRDVPRATTPLLPGKGDTGAKNSGGETRQASPSRRACPPPATGPLPGGEPIAVRRGLAYHLEQRANSTELRDDSDRYLEHADAIPGRLHPQPA